MADGENTESRDELDARQVPHDGTPESSTDEPPGAEFDMELRDSLPGDRAVIGVEEEGRFTWLASRKYVHPKAVEEFKDQLNRIIGEGWWVQNWSGR